MKRAFLTIDDSPFTMTDGLIDFLSSLKIPALLFVRGALMEQPESFAKIVRAIKKGFVIGNHSYAHERTSVAGFEAQTSQILKTQELIDKAYDVAGVPKPPRYFRFPHLDRGAGNAWAIDFETVPEEYRDYVVNLFRDGVRIESLEPPTADKIQLKKNMQQWLIDNGFQKFTTPLVTFPWWLDSELNYAIDVQFTFSTSDWMLGERHVGKWHYKTPEDIEKKMLADPFLKSENSDHIILMHDYDGEILTVSEKLITYFLNQDFEFLPILP